MAALHDIDVSLDLREDAGVDRRGIGRDPDRFSPALRRFHQELWSRRLPGGTVFNLTDERLGDYLHHRSGIGEFFLASDSIVHSLGSLSDMQALVERVPRTELDAFERVGYTVGGTIVFPSNRVDGRPTINGARGMHPRVRDRFDLTLECIRRWYAGAEPNPLAAAFGRYAAFFDLFRDFRGYVDFFLLQDLVTEDGTAVRFFTDAVDLTASPLPHDLEAYREYLRRGMDFVRARNARIRETTV